MNFSRFISAISKARKPSPIREATALVASGPPTLISLGGGYPNPSTFPFKSIQVESTDGNKFTLDGKDLSKALQYTESSGIADLRSWLSRIHKKYHDSPLQRDGALNFCITSGSQDGLIKTFEMLLSPGDNVLVEEPLYSGTLAILKPLPVNLVGVETDALGLHPDSLLKVLSNWDPKDAADPNSDIPKVLYTVPNCGNPTGASASAGRKRKVYEIAQRYDLVIIEDDPYFFLQFQKDTAPSYQSIDTDGRVIRSDSMSKILSSGIRLGWISGAKPFIERIVLHQQASVMHCSTLSQVLAIKLLDLWNLEGFEKHLDSIRQFYKSQRDIAISSATKWLTGLAEWSVPEGGMFLWIRIPEVSDTREMIMKRALEKEVIIIPGGCFSLKEDQPSSYCRISYSSSSPQDLDEGIRRLSEVIRDEIG